MRLFILISLIVAFGNTLALPVKEKKEEHKDEAQNPADDSQYDWETNLEYGRYLKEVVNALENDQEFRKKLDSADPEDIKSGKIAQNLHFVDHNVRTKLDELKRRELERLRHFAIQEHEKKLGVDRTKLKIPGHVDHRNPARFEAEDLRKLISQLNKDLEEADNKRQKEFKQHEMGKEFEYQQQLKGTDEEHKKEMQLKHEEELKKHKDHPKLHHPGSKQQLEEVWEAQDHMRAEDFDPRTFFHLHDLDGNGMWDHNEVKSLFQKELDKMYDPNAPEDDIVERYEEMERMREHVFRESDLNSDNFISFDEFMEQTRKNDFERDPGWEGLDEQELYSQQEYEAYERQRNEEIQRLIDSGDIQPPPGFELHHPQSVQNLGMHPNAIPESHPAASQGHAVPQGYQAVPQGYQAVPQGYQAAPQGYQAVPQGYQAVPQGYQAAPQGYQAVPQGYQAVPQGYQPPPQGYQPPPQGYQPPPQGYQPPPQGYQPPPQGSQQGQPIPQQPVANVPSSKVIAANIDPEDKRPEHKPSLKVQHQQVPPQPVHSKDNLGQAPPVEPIESNRIPGTK